MYIIISLCKMLYITIFDYYRNSLKGRKYNVLKDILKELYQIIQIVNSNLTFELHVLHLKFYWQFSPNIENNLDTGRSTTSVEKQLLLVIWFLATPDSYRYVFVYVLCERVNMHINIYLLYYNCRVVLYIRGRTRGCQDVNSEGDYRIPRRQVYPFREL